MPLDRRDALKAAPPRGGFLSLKPGLYCAGSGEVRFRDFQYKVLDD